MNNTLIKETKIKGDYLCNKGFYPPPPQKKIRGCKGINSTFIRELKITSVIK